MHPRSEALEAFLALNTRIYLGEGGFRTFIICIQIGLEIHICGLAKEDAPINFSTALLSWHLDDLAKLSIL
jgi:hypothetical protein